MSTLVTQYSSSSTNEWVFGGRIFGQSFIWDQEGHRISSCVFRLAKTGSPTGSIYARLYSHAGTYGSTSYGNTILATSDAIDISTIPTSATDITFTFSTTYEPVNGTKYYVAVYYADGTVANCAYVYYASSGTHPGNASIYTGTWTYYSSGDAYFKVYSEASSVTLIDTYAISNYSSYISLYNGTSIEAGQSFTCGVSGYSVTGASAVAWKVASPTGSMYARIYSHSGTYGTDSIPATLLGTSNALDVSTLSTSSGEYMTAFTFGTPVALSLNTYYVVTFGYSGGDSTNKVRIGTDTSSPSHNGNSCSQITSWGANNAVDVLFEVNGKVYSGLYGALGLAKASISQVNGLAIASVSNMIGLA